MSEKNNKIKLHLSEPYLMDGGLNTIMACDVSSSDGWNHKKENGMQRTIWFKVPQEYKGYLSADRCDSFVVSLLPYAMKEGYDLHCSAPCSESLIHNICMYLIPPLVKYNSYYHETEIVCDCADEYSSGPGIGTGISLGVDSTHTISRYINTKYKSYKLNHLCNISCTGNYSKKVYAEMSKLSNELKIPLINITSNILKIINSNFYFLHHTFYNLGSILALEKLFGKYYYASSGYDYDYFSFREPPGGNSCHYDPISVASLSTGSTTFYNEGAHLSRSEKLRNFSNTPIRNYMNCCWNISIMERPCGWCDKCKRTLSELDSLGLIEKYATVFDLPEYFKYRKIYVMNSILRKDNSYYSEPYEYYKRTNPILFTEARNDIKMLKNNEDPILYFAVDSGSRSATHLLVKGLLRGQIGGVELTKNIAKAVELSKKLYDESKNVKDKELLIEALNSTLNVNDDNILALLSNDLSDSCKLIISKILDKRNRKSAIDLLRTCNDDSSKIYLSSRLRWGDEVSKKESIEILSSLSEKNADARGALAIEYYEGQIVKKDLEKAIELMRNSQDENWCVPYLIRWLFESKKTEYEEEAIKLCKIYDYLQTVKKN